MNRILKFVVVIAIAGVLALNAAAQDGDKASVVSAASSKLGPLPGLPACLTLSAQRGDPAKGGAVILARMTTGCSVPWHWHTAAEALLMVSGKGKLEMKDAAASTVGAADYVYLPGKHPHQFTCLSACTFFDVTEGAFDIHYIDKDGKEIPPDQALKAKAGPAKKSGGKK